jgi:parallel beta-helix repeat protein
VIGILGRKTVVASVLLAAFLGIPAAWGASVYHVDGGNPTCSDSGPGSDAEPFCTIGRGAAVAQAGDSVLVHMAVYPETVTVPRSGTSTSPIVFESAPGEIPVVTGGTYGFRLSGRNWITIRSFAVTDSVRQGIYATNGTGVTISGNEVSSAGAPVSGEVASGIYLKGMTGSLVEANSVHHNSNHGVQLGGGTTGTTIRGNEVFQNARQFSRAAAGIHIAGSGSNVIETNIAYANEDSGFNIRDAANNNLVARNVARNNGDHGFDTLRATGTQYIANTSYGNNTDGLSVEGSSTGTVIANCISADNSKYELFVDSGSAPGFTADFDVLWDVDPAASADIKYSGTRYKTVEAFAAATPHEANGIGANPMFVAPPADLHLAPSSPAIDSANSGVSGHPSVDLEGNPRVDDSAVDNTGVGPREYDDRGAYERQEVTTSTPDTEGVFARPRARGLAPGR